MLKNILSVMLTLGCLFVFATTGLAQSPVTITELTICRDILDREPVDPGTSFSNDVEKLYCFTRASAVEKTSIKHVWYLEGEKRAELSFAIGASPSWRTNSSKIIRPIDAGTWKVEVIGPADEVLKTIEFVVEK